MLFTVSTIIGLAATSLAAPSLLSSRQDSNSTLQPWKLDSIGSFSPSGRPGSYPWSTITVSQITDPNELVLGTGGDGKPVTVPANNTVKNCVAKWFAYTSPLGHIWPCDASENGYWYMEFVDTGSFTIGKFDVKFTRVADVIGVANGIGSEYKKSYTGTAHFEVGDNMSGSCGGSGVCSWGLKAEDSPWPIQPQEAS